MFHAVRCRLYFCREKYNQSYCKWKAQGQANLLSSRSKLNMWFCCPVLLLWVDATWWGFSCKRFTKLCFNYWINVELLNYFSKGNTVSVWKEHLSLKCLQEVSILIYRWYMAKSNKNIASACKSVSFHWCQGISANLLWFWITNLCMCLKGRCTPCSLCCIGYAMYSTYTALRRLWCVRHAPWEHTSRQTASLEPAADPYLGALLSGPGGPGWGCSLLSFVLLSSL